MIPACEHAYNLIYAKYFEKRYGESVSLFSSGFKDLLNYESANPIRFTPTALFAVRKETILRNSREYYINLARTMSRSVDYTCCVVCMYVYVYKSIHTYICIHCTYLLSYLLILTINSARDPFIGHFFERAWPEVFHSNCSSGPEYRCHYNKEVNC